MMDDSYVLIGYGATNWKKYVDEQGVTRRGNVVALDMVTAEREDSPGPSSRQVGDFGIGQEIVFGGYRIKVIDIGRTGGLFRGFYWVRLAISPEETPK